MDPKLNAEDLDRALHFDGEVDREEEPHASVVPPAQEKENKTDPEALKRAGATSTKRIAGAAAKPITKGPGSAEWRSDPMHDPKVIAELHHATASENDIAFPYDAQVITSQDPLRLRESSSLTARVMSRMPRGHKVRVTGKSQNHFRPVVFQPAADQPEIKGWAFTAYLTPPTHHADGKPITKPMLPTVTVVASEDAPLTTKETVEIAAPALHGPEIAVTDPAIAGRVVEDVTKLNGPTPSLSTGLHYKDSYRYELEGIGRGKDWNPAWEMGHTESKLWKQPFDLGDPMTWELREDASASQALKEWLAGLTIADCSSAMVAIELDAVRASVGEKVFDRCFGGSAGKGRLQQLKISQRISATPLYALLRYTDGATNAATNSGSLGKRPVKVGEWYYFSNVPDYVHKHPGGAWRGENALYVGEQDGKQMWSGFGVTADEEGMLRALVDRYNAPRDAHDFAWLNHAYTVKENWPVEYRDGYAAVDPATSPVRNDGKRDQIKVDDLITAQKKAPVDAKAKKGDKGPAVAAAPATPQPGLQLSTGMTLSTDKLAELAKKYGADAPAPSEAPKKSEVLNA